MTCQKCNCQIPEGTTQCPACGTVAANQSTDVKKTIWRAIVSFVLGGISCLISWGTPAEVIDNDETALGFLLICGIPSALAVFIGIVSLVKKQKGAVLAIIGMILAVAAFFI